MKLQMAGRICVNDEWWELEHRVLDARLIQETVVVVFDYRDYSSDKPTPNVVAFNLKKQQIWIAENPTKEVPDGYTEILQEDPLLVGNYRGYACHIDLETGKIRNAYFTK